MDYGLRDMSYVPVIFVLFILKEIKVIEVSLFKKKTDERFRSQRPFSLAIGAGHYNSAQVCVQAQVHSLFLYSLGPMIRQVDTTEKRSSAGPIA